MARQCIMCYAPTRQRKAKTKIAPNALSEFCSQACEAHAGRVWADQYYWCERCQCWNLEGETCGCPEALRKADE